MSLLPVEIVKDIKLVMIEMKLMDPEERDYPQKDEKIQSHAVLLFRVMKDLENLSLKEAYRVVEFGCGDNLFMFKLVLSITRLMHKKVKYVGIDKDEERLNTTVELPDYLKDTCQFILADASDIKWRDKIWSPTAKFHAAIFNNPIVQDPYVASQEYDREDFEKYGRVPDAGVLARRAMNSPPLLEQYNQFTIIFTQVLKECLEPSASLLIRTFHSREYPAVIKILRPLATGLPEPDQEIPSHQCLAVTFKA